MPIINLFSAREARKRSGGSAEVYQYTDIPQALRAQIVHILNDAFGAPSAYGNPAEGYFERIHDLLCREYGIFQLNEHASGRHPQYRAAVLDYICKEHNAERVLDTVESCFRVIDNLCRHYDFKRIAKARIDPDEALIELNARFRSHGVGYQIEAGEVIRIDSTLIHSEVVIPALELLRDSSFKGPNDEFLKAHEHYRHGRYKEAINDALKALESTLKVICGLKKWPYSDKDTAAKLLGVCFDNGLIANLHLAHFSSLRAGLESGVPTIRNKLGGHGQGAEPIEAPDYIVGYQLNLAAASIVFLVKALQSTQGKNG